ncbi:uncharacterized protein LOC120010766 [Tripterygium wilfordii]|uniref:uncharacterized protein LOC120010766 n=1 Tax=Tripterygium wilfordii TaxID=458696 RepID=UPI0018F817C1|nr:uncharacterized protein LOC120010766 [Tripterygium wilfordii]
MPVSFVRFRLAIMVRESFSTATFRSVASRNLIGAYSGETHVPSLTSSMKATAPTTRSWSSMGLDQKEVKKQIDGSYKIAKADGMGQAGNQVDMSFSKFSDQDSFLRRMQEDFSKYAKFYDKEFLKRSWEEGRAREVFREWKEAQKRVYADSEEEEMRFKIFESLFKYAVETNSKGTLLMGLNNFADKTEEELKRPTKGYEVCPAKIRRSLRKRYTIKRVEELLPLAVMLAIDSFGEFFKDSDDVLGDEFCDWESDDEWLGDGHV